MSIMRALVTRAALAIVALGTIALLSSTDGWSQAGRTIRIVVPFPPGGSADILARLLGEQVGKLSGATVVIENRPGVIASPGIRDGGLGIKEVEIQKAKPLGGQMERCRHKMAAGGDPIQLHERVQPFFLLLVIGKWQSVHGCLANLVLKSFRNK